MKVSNEFLNGATKRSIQFFVSNIKNISQSSSKLLETGVNENALVISLNKATELVEKIPFIVAHQIIYRKLKIRPLLDPWEVVHFKERKHWTNKIAKYLKQFNIDPMDNNLIANIAIELSNPLNQNSVTAEKIIATGAFISDPLLQRSIAMATRDVWGYNIFSGLFQDIEIVERMSNLDTAFNLQNFKSIIPVRVFSDFVEITDSLQIIDHIDESKMDGSKILLHGVYRDLEDLRNELEEVLSQFVKKYTILSGERPINFGKHLINFYTMTPKDMIKRLGPNIICCPFEVPEDLKFKELGAKDWEGEDTTFENLGHYQMLVY